MENFKFVIKDKIDPVKSAEGGVLPKLEKFNLVNQLPNTAGVYCFIEGKNTIYIGKAINIKDRVKNHFLQPTYKDNFFIELFKMANKKIANFLANIKYFKDYELSTETSSALTTYRWDVEKRGVQVKRVSLFSSWLRMCTSSGLTMKVFVTT